MPVNYQPISFLTLTSKNPTSSKPETMGVIASNAPALNPPAPATSNFCVSV